MGGHVYGVVAGEEEAEWAFVEELLGVGEGVGDVYARTNLRLTHQQHQYLIQIELQQRRLQLPQHRKRKKEQKFRSLGEEVGPQAVDLREAERVCEEGHDPLDEVEVVLEVDCLEMLG